MRIAFVAPTHPYRGGIAHFATRLARETAGSDDVLFLNFSRLYPGILFPGKTQYDLSRDEFAFPSERILDSINPVSWLKTAGRIRDWGAEVVVFHYWHPFFARAFAMIAAHCGKAKRIAILHNVTPHEAGVLSRVLVRPFLMRMDGVILHARSELNDLQVISKSVPYALAFHPIYDLFPGETTTKEEARRQLGLDDSERVVLYFGLIRKYKGVGVLLKAMKLLGDIPNLRLLVVGEIYDGREELLALSRELGDRVQLVDRYVPNEEVAVYFRASDLVALPYRNATQSGVVPIAYRCDRPVLATSVGGLPDVIEEGISGYLVPPHDADAFACALRRHFLTLGNPEMREGLAQMRERLGWGRYNEILHHLIAEVREP